MDSLRIKPDRGRKYAVHCESIDYTINYYKAFYTILGMIEPSKGHDNYKQGFELTSMSHTL